MEQTDIRQTLKKLPQGRFLSESGLDEFAVRFRDDPNVERQIERLSGIGGSECGIAVADARGEKDIFNKTAADLTREKLLVEMPSRATGAMKFELLAEKTLREMFLSEYGARRDGETLVRFESFSRPQNHEWMRFTPADVVLISNRRYLVEYKVPDEPYDIHRLPLRHLAQLHQGQEFLRYNDVRIDGMLFCQYPLNERRMIVSEVIFDPLLMSEIYEANDRLWSGFVLKGRVAPSNSFPEKDMSSDPEFARLAHAFTAAKLVANEAGDVARALQAELRSAIERNYRHSTRIHMSGLSITTEMSFDVNAAAQLLGEAAPREQVLDAALMAAYLRREGVDLSKFETGESRWNEKEVRRALVARGHDVSRFMVSSENSRMTILKKDPAIIAGKEIARKQVAEAFGQVGRAIPRSGTEADSHPCASAMH